MAESGFKRAFSGQVACALFAQEDSDSVGTWSPIHGAGRCEETKGDSTLLKYSSGRLFCYECTSAYVSWSGKVLKFGKTVIHARADKGQIVKSKRAVTSKGMFAGAKTCFPQKAMMPVN